eukprot:4336491-Ditylum_brightwellii.AAC.1
MATFCNVLLTRATLILQGKAVWLTKPTVSHVFLNEIVALFENDAQLSERSIDAHAAQMNQIMENIDLQKRKILFVLPDGVECSATSKDTVPIEDEQISPVLHVIKRTNVTLNDGYRKILKCEEEVECDLFAELTKGMKDTEVG